MITEGILTEIDYATNKCFVRLPVFEKVDSADQIIAEGRIAIQPGAYNGYQVNDAVWVGFIDYKFDKPIVIGKIYQGPIKETSVNGGQLTVSSLNISGTDATIPKETKISGITEYSSVQSIINELKSYKEVISASKDRIFELEEQIKQINTVLGNALADITGAILYDANSELLTEPEKRWESKPSTEVQQVFRFKKEKK